MIVTRPSAHPILEPLDYALTPEIAATRLQGDDLAVYTLLWNAALATAMDGPALRVEHLSLALRCANAPDADFGMQLRSSQVACQDPGWGQLLASEQRCAQTSADEFAASFAPQIAQALAATGPGQLDAAGRRRRGDSACAPAAQLLGNPCDWSVDAVMLRDPALRMDQLIEQMAQHGIGRPSTYADRLAAALENDLIEDDGARLRVGQYGQTLLRHLDGTAPLARVDAAFSADLEQQLAAIETLPARAGEVLGVFIERALGQQSALTAWLDALLVDGESMSDTAARVEMMLPATNGWKAFHLPAGLAPENLVRDAVRASQLREDLDTALAAPDRAGWRQASPRGRAAARLCMLEAHPAFPGGDDLLMHSARDIALRWWIDLAPDEARLNAADLAQARARAAAVADAPAWPTIALLLDALAAAL